MYRVHGPNYMSFFSISTWYPIAKANWRTNKRVVSIYISKNILEYSHLDVKCQINTYCTTSNRPFLLLLFNFPRFQLHLKLKVFKRFRKSVPLSRIFVDLKRSLRGFRKFTWIFKDSSVIFPWNSILFIPKSLGEFKLTSGTQF